jgi:hypothetical protein
LPAVGEQTGNLLACDRHLAHLAAHDIFDEVRKSQFLRHPRRYRALKQVENGEQQQAEHGPKDEVTVILHARVFSI